MATKKQTAPSGLAELKAALKSGEFQRLYLFFGEEDYLRSYYLELLKKKLLSDGLEDFNFHRFEGKELTPQAFSDAVEALPMMAEHTLVEVDDFDLFRAPEGEREKYCQILSDIPEYCTAVFVYDTVSYSPDGRIKKLSAVLKEHAVPVEFQKQSSRELATWVARHFRALGKTIDEPLAEYLVFLTGGGMTALSAEIDKIAAYSRAEAISRSDIDALVEPVLDAAVFDITNALADGNFDQALKKLHEIFQMQQEPIPVLAVIGSQIRRMRAAQLLLSAGKGTGELTKLCGISDYAARLTVKSARSFSRAWCDRAAVACMQADYELKTSFDDGERIIELLLASLWEDAHAAR